MDSRKKGGIGCKSTASAAATEADLSMKALEEAEEIVEGKRRAFNNNSKKGGVPPASRKKRSADGNMSCPVLASIAASHPGRSTLTSTSKQPAEVAADPKPQEEFEWSGTSPAFVAAMRGMTPERLLECLEGLNVPAAAKIRVKLEEAQQLQGASKKALADASKQARINEGRRTWRTLLTAAAYDGDEPSRVTSKRKAEILGVHEPYITAARQRVQALKPDLDLTAAMDDDAYWFQPRARRSDATSPEM